MSEAQAEAAPAAPVETPAAPPVTAEAAPPPVEMSPEAKALAILEGKIPVPGAQPEETPAEAAPAEAAPPPPVPEPETKPEDERLARRFEAIAREQAKARKEREEAKRLKEQIEAEVAPYKRAAELAKTSKLAALQALGISYDDVTGEILNGQGKPVEPQALKLPKDVQEKLELVPQLVQYIQQQEARAQHAEVAANRAAFRADILTTAKASEAETPLAAKADWAIDAAQEWIERQFEATGEIPGGSKQAAIKLALKEVDSTLRQLVEGLSLTGQTGTVAGAVSKSAAPRPQVNSGQTKTLTNSQAGVAPPRTPVDQLSDEERYQLALRVLETGKVPGL